MYNQAGLNAYQKNNLSVSSKPKLVEMMYEGILRFLAQAKKYAEEDNIEKKVYWVNRAISVYGEFIAILDYDKGGDVAHYLNGLYAYKIRILSESISYTGDEKHQAIERIDTCINTTKELLSAWRDVNISKTQAPQ